MHRSTKRRCVAHVLFWTAQALLVCPVLGDSDDKTINVFQPEVGNHGPIQEHVEWMHRALRNAERQARKASRARSLDALKQEIADIHAMVWGIRMNADHLETPYPDWKSQWQVSYDQFDPEFAHRYGTDKPALTPSQLGFVGRGRYIRQTVMQGLGNQVPEGIAALNNVIGWMRIDDGVTKAERQPRIDLTYRWDAPNSFWQSTADTGWIFEVYAQALNILKTNYGDDLKLAKQHARDLRSLLRKCRRGDGNPGLDTARRLLQEWSAA
ncbi:MAG: hypothetical protein AAF541_07290 [Pseudomonadota bacterium]